MADDKEVNVKLSADVKSLLQGMKEAQEHTETAVAGMKGDLGSAIESFEKFGAQAVAIGAVGLAFESLGEIKDTVLEAVHATNELTESFESLNKRTGASFEDLSVYKNALVLTGGTMGDLSGILNGLQRKMASSPEIYMANGIAADEMALSHQDLMTTLSKSVQVIASIEDPGRRSEVAIALLGGRAQAILPQIMKMNEMIEKEGVDALKKLGAHIDEDAIAKLDHFEIETGKVKLEIEKINQTLADNGQGWAIWGQKMNLAWHQATLAASDFWRTAFPDLLGDEERKGVALRVQWAKEGLLPKSEEAHAAEGGANPTPGAGGGGGVTPKDLENAKKAAAERVATRKAADEEIIRSSHFSVAEQLKDDKELVASGQMTYADLVADMKAAYKADYDTSLAALKDKEKLAKQGSTEYEAVLIQEKQLKEKFNADIREVERQAAENGRKEKEKEAAEAEKTRKQNLELAKLATQEELNLLRFVMDEKEQALDEDLAFGRINEAQWVAMKKAGITQELRAQLDALDQEQKAAKDDLVHWQKIQNQKDALNRKAYADLNKLDTEATARAKARWDSFFGSMTGGFNSAITGLVKGTMTWGQAFNEVLDQGLSGLISFFVNWGEQEAIKWATSLVMGKASRSTEIVGAASTYAVNAMGSVAAIPFYGWAMAPEVGATAFAEGMSFLPSAAGGWDRVPADTLAMIHKNEQVLPASYAEGLRNLVASRENGGAGAGGSSTTNITIQAIDAQSFKQALSRNQGGLLSVLKEAGRNGRLM